MEEFKIAQLTKELVADRLKGMEDPCRAAAGLVKQTLRVALSGREAGLEGPPSLIQQACRGGITGLLLAEQDLARGCVAVLMVVVELASEFDLEPTEAMQSALLGLSDLRRFVAPDELQRIGREIEARFMGAGDAFLVLVKEGLVPPLPPGSRPL